MSESFIDLSVSKTWKTVIEWSFIGKPIQPRLNKQDVLSTSINHNHQRLKKNVKQSTSHYVDGKDHTTKERNSTSLPVWLSHSGDPAPCDHFGAAGQAKARRHRRDIGHPPVTSPTSATGGEAAAQQAEREDHPRRKGESGEGVQDRKEGTMEENEEQRALYTRAKRRDGAFPNRAGLNRKRQRTGTQTTSSVNWSHCTRFHKLMLETYHTSCRRSLAFPRS